MTKKQYDEIIEVLQRTGCHDDLIEALEQTTGYGTAAEIARLRGVLQEIAEYNHTGMQAIVAKRALEE